MKKKFSTKESETILDSFFIDDIFRYVFYTVANNEILYYQIQHIKDRLCEIKMWIHLFKPITHKNVGFTKYFGGVIFYINPGQNYYWKFYVESEEYYLEEKNQKTNTSVIYHLTKFTSQK
jgi:hypothetical protein